MKISFQRASASEVHATGYHSVTQSVTIVAPTPRRRTRQVRRTRTALHPRVSTDGLVEVTLVRSARNRLGGGPRARPAPAR